MKLSDREATSPPDLELTGAHDLDRIEMTAGALLESVRCLFLSGSLEAWKDLSLLQLQLSRLPASKNISNVSSNRIEGGDAAARV